MPLRPESSSSKGPILRHRSTWPAPERVVAQLRAEATVVSDVRRLRAKLNATPPGSALANANTAELAKSAASGVFCAHLTTARRPVPDRAEQGRQVSDGQCRHGAAPWLKAVQRPCRGHQSVRPGADTRGCETAGAAAEALALCA